MRSQVGMSTAFVVEESLIEQTYANRKPRTKRGSDVDIERFLVDDNPLIVLYEK